MGGWRRRDGTRRHGDVATWGRGDTGDVATRGWDAAGLVTFPGQAGLCRGSGADSCEEMEP